MTNHQSKANQTRRKWWLLYTAGILLTLTALAAGTTIIITLDHTAQRAAATADRQASLRLALWRLDAWFSPLLFQESARTPDDYASTNPDSPLINFESKFIPIHFEISPTGIVTSPQSAAQPAFLEQIRNAVQATDFARKIKLAESAAASNYQLMQSPSSVNELPAVAADQDTAPNNNTQRQESARGSQQYDSQKRSNVVQQSIANRGQTKSQSKGAPQQFDQANEGFPSPPEFPDLQVGPFIPMWLNNQNSNTSTKQLAFIRRLHAPNHESQQGFLINWQIITQAMQKEVADLFPSATLAPVYTVWGSADPPDLALAGLPATLVVAPLDFSNINLSTPTSLTLILTYTLVILAVTAIGIALKGGIAFGDKRNRFASAVTHELRTPLTTFRMYSEMLAQDMVPPGEQKTYLHTLEREARRLESLVNNVLAYARLEEGRPQNLTQAAPANPQPAIEILNRFLPDWQTRAQDANLTLEFQSNLDPSHKINADPEALGQIIFNLIENACKYGQSESNPTIQLNAQTDQQNQILTITLTDHGPGIDPTKINNLFKPFERAHNDPTKPGLGLGLALAKSLAQNLAGNLTLHQTNPTTFRLTLPLQS